LPWALPAPAAAHRSSLPVIYGEDCLPGLDLLRPAEEATTVVSEDELLERGILIEENWPNSRSRSAWWMPMPGR
jgi:S-DNA-T family DNA segregation ATPase FtsK/SpoIIIE